MFSSFSQSLRALTKSPITSALALARRQARHYEAGGKIAAERQEGGFVIPADIDTSALIVAIKAKLNVSRRFASGRPDATGSVLERLKDGRVLVRPEWVARLAPVNSEEHRSGDNDVERGTRVLSSIVKDIRAERVLRRALDKNNLPAPSGM